MATMQALDLAALRAQLEALPIPEATPMVEASDLQAGDQQLAVALCVSCGDANVEMLRRQCSCCCDRCFCK